MRLFISFALQTTTGTIYDNMCVDTMMLPRSLERIREMEDQILKSLLAADKPYPDNELPHVYRLTILHFQPI